MKGIHFLHLLAKKCSVNTMPTVFDPGFVTERVLCTRFGCMLLFAGMILSVSILVSLSAADIIYQYSATVQAYAYKTKWRYWPKLPGGCTVSERCLAAAAGATAVVYIHHVPCLASHSVSVFPVVLQSDLFLMSRPLFCICLWNEMYIIVIHR